MRNAALIPRPSSLIPAYRRVTSAPGAYTIARMLRNVQDRYLPPDHEAFIAGEPATGRVIVIAPTRAACETIEIAVGLHLDTYLERTHGQQVRELARGGRGFGIVAGTGTGKTLAIRPIAEEIVKAPLRVGVVNREREATPELPSLNVVVVTTGIARRWFQDGDILPHDTLIVDEIHQTSAELELCLALGKRVGCRFIWLSATVDPAFYRAYLSSADVIEVYSFDPDKAATVTVVNSEPPEFLDHRFLSQIIRDQRGVGLFLPTRAGVEQAVTAVHRRFPKLNAAFYHGGEPIRVIRPFLEEGGAPKPYLLAMTAAGQSALNVRGLDTVVIADSRYSSIVMHGRNVLTRLHLGSNEILQMAGRVHGRVENGRVFILSDRPIDFTRLQPTAPEFQLAGDSERVALTCADLGVRADELDLPVQLDQQAYRRAFAMLQGRGIIDTRGRLSPYGKAVEALPVDRPWAELLVNADDQLAPYLAIASGIESLHRMTRDERDLSGLIVAGSDHLTAYNVYAEAFQRAGYIGEVHGLPRHLFEPEAMAKWADWRGVLVKSLEDTALATAAIFRGLGLPLPTKLPLVDEKTFHRFTDLLARVMPFDLVVDGMTPEGQPAAVSKSSVCGGWGAIIGTLSYFADRFGVPRASIEGTQIHLAQMRRHAQLGPPEFVFNGQHAKSNLMLHRTNQYFGFVLERQTERVEAFPREFIGAARRALAEALARGEDRHPAAKKNHAAAEVVRELYQRSGGTTPRLGFAELAAHYERQLEEQNVTSLQEFRAARLTLRVDDFVPPDQQRALRALPGTVVVRGTAVDVHYEVEEDPARQGVARLRLPEKLARTLCEEELPALDRPLRFIVTRGQRGAVRAASLAELQRLLAGDEEKPAARTEHKPPVQHRGRGSRRNIPAGGGRSARSSGRRRSR